MSTEDDWCDWCALPIEAGNRIRIGDRVFCSRECAASFRRGKDTPAVIRFRGLR